MAEDAVFTVKEWLARIEQKQDTFDEKLDRTLERLDRKADQADFVALQQRVALLDQQNATRLDMWKALSEQVTRNSEAIRGDTGLQNTKADKSDVLALWRVLVGALSGTAIAIVAWGLTTFVK